MDAPETHRCQPAPPPPAAARSTAMDLLLVLLLAASVVLIAAHGPSTTHAYAQVYSIGSLLSITEGGHWLLPSNPMRGLYRKPPLYLWLAAPVPKVTGLYNDFVFRLPTIAAFLAAAVMVYFMGRRWFGPNAGLLAAALWVIIIHMAKLSYLAMTDMLFAACIIGSILCADRLLFHRCAAPSRWKWAVSFWATMILGALTKGWGLVNPVLVGGTVALAAALGPGWRPLRMLRGRRNRFVVALVLVLRRWKRAAKALHLGWGILAMVCVLGPLILAMAVAGGEDFRYVLYKEFWQRLTGAGAKPPRPTSVPAAVQLFYHAFPASFFALGALFLVHPRRWFSRRGPLWLSLCWILAVVVPFSFAHGFRPDYLLPCYAAVALMGAWAVHCLADAEPRGKFRLSMVRHLFAAAPVIAGALLVALPVLYFLSPYLAHPVLAVPETVAPATRWVLAVIPVFGIVVILLAVRASLGWHIRRLAWLAVLALPGVMFIKTHVLSEQARTLDGEKMIAFARAARPVVRDDGFAVFRIERACVPLYLGRFGMRVESSLDLEEALNGSDVRWLLISDRGLVEAGAALPNADGAYRLKYAGAGYAFDPEPDRFGDVRVRSDNPILLQDFGRLYLIEVRRPVALPATPAGPQDGWQEYEEMNDDDA
ncbi:MAG: glycosyltransferase family 39 protein [Planctomycetota bacterium]|nr:glycosyltransferase family 39 protein [Planctomycetota bacterium]